MKRALITGAGGQDGLYLAELLLAKEYKVFGLPGPEADAYRAWAQTNGLDVTVVEGDMSSSASLSRMIEECDPDEVYNLAALSSVAASWEQPELYAEINALGALRLLDAVSTHAPQARFIQASSAEIFGDPHYVPQDESTPVRPINPYGVSKAFAYFTVTNSRSRGVHASNAIMYNHESPRRPTSYVSGKIAEGVAQIVLGKGSELDLGNIDAVRDWGFAGDYVEALALIAAAETPDDYVVATGVGRTVREFAQTAFAHVGLDYEDYLVVDAALYRPADASELVGDASKIKARLGWEPKTPFAQMVGAMVEEHIRGLSG